LKGLAVKLTTLLKIVFRAVAIIALGGFFLATYLQAKEFPIMTYWPVVLVLLGVWGLLSSKESRVWGVLFFVTGIAIYFFNQGVLTLNVVMLYWPAILIAVGTFTLVRSLVAWISWNKVIAAEIIRTRQTTQQRSLFG
jgi:hypothetical protein